MPTKKTTTKTGGRTTPAKKATKKAAAPSMASKAKIRKKPAARSNGNSPEIFNPRAALAAIAAEQYPPFQFYSWDGTTVCELPNPLTLDPIEIRQALGLEPTAEFNPEDLDDLSVEQYFEMLENLVPEAWAAIQEMPLGARQETLAQWNQWMVDEVGEEGKEQSRSSSPNRAARRSKRT